MAAANWGVLIKALGDVATSSDKTNAQLAGLPDRLASVMKSGSGSGSRQDAAYLGGNARQRINQQLSDQGIKPLDPETGSERLARRVNFASTGMGGALSAWENPDVQRDWITQGREQSRDPSLSKGQRFLGGTKEVMGHAFAGLQNRSELSGMGDMMRAGGAAAGHIPVVGKPIEAVAKFGDVVLKSIDKLEKWNDGLKQANFQFAEFSGSMASVKAQSDARQIQLSQERGERRAWTAGLQAEAADNLEKETAIFKDAFSGAKDLVSFGLTSITSLAVKSLKEVTGIAALEAKWKPQEEEGAQTMGDWMGETGKDYWQETYGRPADF